MQVRRPLLFSAIDSVGASALARIDRDFAGTTNLTVNALCDPGGTDLDVRSDDEITADVNALFEQAQFWMQDIAVWVVAGELAAPGARDVLMWRVLPLAEAQVRAHRPLFLIILAGDTNAGEPAAADALAALAADLEARDLVGSAQIFLLRTHGSAGFSIGSPRSLVDYLALASEAIVLADDMDTDPGVLLKLVQPPALSVAERRPAGEAPVFGRLGAIRIRPVVDVATEVWARIAVGRFARELVEGRHRTPTGWDPGTIPIHPPDLSGTTGREIAAGAKQGPILRFPGPPSIRRDPNAEFARIARGCDEWQRGLDAWTREVRLSFDTLVREHREGAARERDRVKAVIKEMLEHLWQDPSRDAPHLYARQALEKLERTWTDEAARSLESDRPLRQASESEVRSGMQAQLAGLAREMRRRPNVQLMGFFGVLTFVLASLVVQSAIGTLDLGRLTAGLDIARDVKLLLWRAIGVGVVGIAVALPLLWALLRARGRWYRAWSSVRSFAQGTERRATEDVAQELALVNHHWQTKTVFASAAYADRCARRLADLVRVLHTFAGQPDPVLRPASTLERLVPEGPQVSAKLDDLAHALIAAALDPERTVLRSPRAADAWIDGGSRTWPRDRELEVRSAMAMDIRDDAARNELDDLLGDLDEAVRHISVEWPRIATNLLLRPAAGPPPTPRVDVVFVSGFEALAEDATRFGERIDITGRGDQILAVRAQTGLDLAEASA